MGNLDFVVAEEWPAAYPGARAGLMVMEGVANPERDDRLDAVLDKAAADLRARFADLTRADLLARPEMALYHAHYRRFDKTYHVLLQLESVVFKAKPIRSRGTLVAAMFHGELATGLLTAGHDLTRIEWPLTLGVVRSGDTYTGIGGREIRGSAGDMCIRDRDGIISSVVYGPDDRTSLQPGTTAVAFTTYAPAGIPADQLRRQLELIAQDVRVVSPAASVKALEIVPS